jgi:hypothetical protein
MQLSEHQEHQSGTRIVSPRNTACASDEPQDAFETPGPERRPGCKEAPFGGCLISVESIGSASRFPRPITGAWCCGGRFWPLARRRSSVQNKLQERRHLYLRNKWFRCEVVCSFEEQTPHFGGTRGVMSSRRLPRVSHRHILCLPITSLTGTTVETMYESACPMEMSMPSSRKK